MSKKPLQILYTIITGSIFLFSCANDEECRMDRYVEMHAGFYTITLNTSTNVETETTLTLTDSLSIRGIGVDSFLYYNAAIKEPLNLPLNKLTDLSEFVFSFKDTLNNIVSDTVSIYYENHEQYLSFECGCINTFTIDSIMSGTTNHYIDSIVINFKEVNTVNVENIKIYRSRR